MTLALNSIIEKTAGLYKQFGIKNITMDDVAAHLGISKKTLYQQVATKEVLIEKVMDMELREKEELFAGCVNAVSAASAKWTQLTRLIFQEIAGKSLAAEFDLKKYYPELYAYYFERFTEINIRHLRQILIEGQQTGEFRKNINPQSFVEVVLSSIMNMTLNEIVPSKKISDECFQKDFASYQLHALMEVKHVQRIEEIIETNYIKTR